MNPLSSVARVGLLAALCGAAQASAFLPLQNPPGLTCPSSSTASSGANTLVGDYDTKEIAEAHRAADQAQAVADKLAEFENLCPDKCTAVPSIACEGEATITRDDTASASVEISGRWTNSIVFDLEADVECTCDD